MRISQYGMKTWAHSASPAIERPRIKFLVKSWVYEHSTRSSYLEGITYIATVRLIRTDRHHFPHSMHLSLPGCVPTCHHRHCRHLVGRRFAELEYANTRHRFGQARQRRCSALVGRSPVPFQTQRLLALCGTGPRTAPVLEHKQQSIRLGNRHCSPVGPGSGSTLLRCR
eukprot:COSAG01_NODE_1405_length_10451_cov_8.718998_8_plen_169_part_00